MFEFSTYHLLLAAAGAAILLSHWFPRLLSGREPASSALAIGFGLAMALAMPQLQTQFDPLRAPKLWETVSEICVIVGLFGVGIRIDRLRNMAAWRPTIRLLAIAMPLTILAVAFAGWLGGLAVATAVVLGAVLAPTDPVLASDVQVGKPLEGGEHPVRFTLTAEAGLNDGLAFPFLYLGLALLSASVWDPALFGEWAWRDVGYRIAVGAAAGVTLGWLIAKLIFDWPSDNALSKTESGLVALAGVFLVYGVTELLEGYGFIAAFVSGLTLRRSETGRDYHAKLHDFVEANERALTALLLLALGAALPSLIPAFGWTEALVAVALIFLIRPVAGWLSLSGLPLSGRERLVVAFYGIRGIGSIYYLAYATTHADLPGAERLWAIVAFTILLSTVVHGFTAGLAVDRATGEGDDTVR